MQDSFQKIQNINNLSTKLYGKKRKNNNNNNNVDMIDLSATCRKYWFKIKLDEFTSLNPITLGPCISPQHLLIYYIKGNLSANILVKKIQKDIGNNDSPYYFLSKYVPSFISPNIWHKEHKLLFSATLETYAALNIADMKSILSTLPVPALWVYATNISDPADFVNIVNTKVSEVYRPLIDFCPYVREHTKLLEMKYDRIYRLDSKTKIEYIENFDTCEDLHPG